MSNQHRDISHVEIAMEIAILESLIDKHGIENVLSSLAAIGNAKVQRLAEIEQNATVAKKWADLVNAIEMLAPEARGL